MRFARVINNLVENLELWDSQPPSMDGVTFVRLPEDSPVGIGYTWNGQDFTPPAPPPQPIPQVITRRQLLRALNILEQRTRDELDQLIRYIIDQAPASPLEKDRLLSSWLDSGSINLADPDTQVLLQYVSQAWGMDQNRIDAVFRLGATFP